MGRAHCGIRQQNAEQERQQEQSVDERMFADGPGRRMAAGNARVMAADRMPISGQELESADGIKEKGGQLYQPHHSGRNKKEYSPFLTRCAMNQANPKAMAARAKLWKINGTREPDMANTPFF